MTILVKQKMSMVNFRRLLKWFIINNIISKTNTFFFIKASTKVMSIRMNAMTKEIKLWSEIVIFICLIILGKMFKKSNLKQRVLKKL